jgi:hypothetical protein
VIETGFAIPGSVSVQLRLSVLPRDAWFAAGLFDGTKILIAQLLIVIRSNVQLGCDRVLRALKQNRRSGQRFGGKSIYETM